MRRPSTRRTALWLPIVASFVACGSSTRSAVDAGGDAPVVDAGPDIVARDAPASDGAREGSVDAAKPDTGPPDGPPSYTSQCTPLSKETGTAIDTSHGRLDGYLSFVVPIGGDDQCNGDNKHVHVQVRVGTDVYDVAVDTGAFTGDVLLYEADMPLPDGAWSEGWHGSDDLTYTSLGVHSSQFTAQDPSALGAKIQAELSGVNHISIFGTGYAQGNGCHEVHYESGSGRDGAMILEPLSDVPHILFFRFSNDSF